MDPRRRLAWVLVVATAAAAAPGIPRLAKAEPAVAAPPAGTGASAGAAVPASLLQGLAKHADAFEQMKRRGAFTFSGKMEELDGDGKPSEVKEIVLRATPRRDPELQPITDVVKYVENGTDKTAEAREKSKERNAKPTKKKKDRDYRLPFLASQQPRYVFTLAERDPVHAERVKIAFVPLEPAEDALKGSAWVDETAGEVLSVGFSLSKNPTFIDHIEVTIVFGLPTPLGRAPSRLSFDGRGGFLFIRKHYRGTGTISEPRVAF